MHSPTSVVLRQGPNSPDADNLRSNAETILGRYESWLWRVARSLAGTSSLYVEDLVQEGRLALWQALRSYDPERGSLPSWLTCKARYRMHEVVQGKPWTGQPSRLHGRYSAAEPATLSLDADLRNGATLADYVAGGDDLEGTELAYHDAELSAAISRLSPAQRRYVESRFWAGMTEEEMKTEVFGYNPVGLWYSKKNGARKKLRQDLGHLRTMVE